MASKGIVLITGANTGIGYQTVKALASSSKTYTVLLGTRSLEKGKDAIEQLKSEVPDTKSEIVPIQIDIMDDASIEKCHKEVESKYGRVDALINNAGAAHDPLMQQIPGPKGVRAAWQTSYDVNVTSTQVFTLAFIPLLLKSSNPRLLFVTSGLSSLTTCAGGRETAMLTSQHPPAGWPKPPAPSALTYRSSKTALNMLMLDWHRILHNDGVKVWAISPGFLATGLGGIGKEKLKSMGAGDASVGGTFITKVVEGERDADTGKVIRSDGVQPW
ncbi:hypothetical protein BDV96DRAFT_496435 [Lophiotrema nucula]|uniref:NAD(P)-binding protein n=1 Tax=Lophiotrema nucula TaxID=690887 RepID=A0A6A5Z2V1_9PLEO|nr:hypothetical protein BDV96DRAFT_496435 [Lophiotrema nucula]